MLVSKSLPVAEGVGFEPTETASASTVFETVPFVRSGTLPRGRDPSASAATVEKEAGEQFAALRRPHPGPEGDLVVEPRVGEHVVERPARTGLRVVGAEDDPGDPGAEQCAGAHRARFEGDDDGDVVEPPATERFGRPADDEQLGVRGRVAEQFAFVVGPGDDLAVAQCDRADGHVAVVESEACLGDGESHGVEVVHGAAR